MATRKADTAEYQWSVLENRFVARPREFDITGAAEGGEADLGDYVWLADEGRYVLAKDWFVDGAPQAMQRPEWEAPEVPDWSGRLSDAESIKTVIAIVERYTAAIDAHMSAWDEYMRIAVGKIKVAAPSNDEVRRLLGATSLAYSEAAGAGSPFGREALLSGLSDIKALADDIESGRSQAPERAAAVIKYVAEVLLGERKQD